MVRFQQLRARVLNPLLKLLALLHITANHITVLSFLTGMSFCVVWYYSRLGAMVCLLLHVILDGLDGSVRALPGNHLRPTLVDRFNVRSNHRRRIDDLPGSVRVRNHYRKLDLYFHLRDSRWICDGS